MSDTPLIAYARRGLARCWMPEAGRWSHRHHLDGRDEPNEAGDLYYSLNCLLGLARAGGAAPGSGEEPRAMFRALAAQMPRERLPLHAHGMALWAAAELGEEPPWLSLALCRAAASDAGALARLNGQGLGLLLSGLAHEARRDAALRPAAQAVRDVVLHRLCGPHGIFFDRPAGWRRDWATFATQVYAGLGLFHAGEWLGDGAALAAARQASAAILARQGPRGEWPWLFHAPSGRIADWHEVYSVHQHGMAPALLHHAAVHGVPGAREGLARGFRWILGENAMGRSMLRPDRGMVLRSQRRTGAAGARAARALRGVANALLAREAPLDGPRLALTPEMRSYELGWILWSWGGRADYPELTGHAGFAA
jgi:hypothetical protein